MGFMDELRKLTQPIDDEDEFFEGADNSGLRQPSPAQIQFEQTFGEEPAAAPEPAEKKPPRQSKPLMEGGLFGGLGGRRPAKPKQQRERVVDFGGSEQQVILFNPKSFDEAGELVNHLNQNRSVVMTLEGLPTDMARRLLDFLSGITFALQGKITPVSAKTYFVTPQNVDILGKQNDQPESDGQYF